MRISGPLAARTIEFSYLPNGIGGSGSSDDKTTLILLKQLRRALWESSQDEVHSMLNQLEKEGRVLPEVLSAIRKLYSRHLDFVMDPNLHNLGPLEVPEDLKIPLINFITEENMDLTVFLKKPYRTKSV